MRTKKSCGTSAIFRQIDHAHLLAQGSDVARSLDDALPSVVMLVELVAEVDEHGAKSRLGHRGGSPRLGCVLGSHVAVTVPFRHDVFLFAFSRYSARSS